MLGDLTVQLSIDPHVNSTLKKVLRTSLKKLTALFSGGPPAGEYPVQVFHRPEEEGPITIIDYSASPVVYRVGVTVWDLTYNQFLYQFGHETCHIFADPRRSNWFVESCCAMMSQVILSRMYKVWHTQRFLLDRVFYAPKIKTYAEQRIQEACEEFFDRKCLPDQAELYQWLTTVKDSLRQHPCHWRRNIIIAEVLRSLFEESKAHWDALRFLGRATSYPPAPDNLTDVNTNSDLRFDRWIDAVPRHLKNFVTRIHDKLQGLIA